MLIPLVLVVYIVMRADPAYIEFLSVGNAINSLKKEPDLKEKSQGDIYTMIKNRFDINDIHRVEKDDVKIQKTTNAVSINIAYEAKVPLFWNVSLALSFHKSVVVR
jgi:hypothetical protein